MSSGQVVVKAWEPRPFQASVEKATEWCPLAPNTCGAEYSAQVATTLEALEALRPVWKKWAQSLDSDIDYFLYSLTHDSGHPRPYVIIVFSEGIAQAMLLGQIRKRQVFTIVSSIRVSGPHAKVLEIKKGGRIGPPSPVIDKLLARELLKATRSGEVDSVCFERLPLQSELFRQVQHLPSFLVKERVPHVFCYSVLALNAPGKKQTDVFTGKARREIRRKTRIVEHAFPGQIQLKCFAQPAELDEGLCDAMRVASATWQNYLGLGLTDTGQTRAAFRFTAQKGWLRIFVLYLKGIPCAFLAGHLYNNTFYCQYAGYSPSFTHFSVGSLLTARAFEHLAAAGVQRIDLGEGGQEHNRRLGCEMVQEGTVHVYSPTLRGIFLNVFFGTTQLVRAGGRKTRARFHLARVGRVWGGFLRSPGKHQQPSGCNR